jgi:hypothetical protein
MLKRIKSESLFFWAIKTFQKYTQTQLEAQLRVADRRKGCLISSIWTRTGTCNMQCVSVTDSFLGYF